MSGPKVTLKVIAGPHLGEVRQFDGHDTLLVGRAENAQLRLPEDLHFSRNHFRVEVKPPQCHLVDLESSNGTFVNGQRVSDIWLRDGDTISGGRTQIQVRIDPLEEGFGTAQYDRAALGATMVPHAPESIGKYRVIRELGSGSMGVVYHARDPETDKEVAVKLIAPGMNLTESAIKTFVREGEVLKKLRHKRIVRFVDAGTDNGSLFLAMEYVECVNLERTLDDLRFKDRVRVSCGLVRQILDGLAYAHDKGLVHRDVKPRNLVVARRPTGLNAKLADFGLAKSYMDAGLSQISGENEIKGTLCFMAPEQVINCRYARPQADLFAAGATLYTLISGQMIYDLKDHRTPLAAVLNSGPIPLTDRVDISDELAAVVDTALAHEADDRYQTASEMRAALDPFYK